MFEDASWLEIGYTATNFVWLIFAAANSGFAVSDLRWLHVNKLNGRRRRLAWQRCRNNHFRLWISLGAVIVGCFAMTVPAALSSERQMSALLTGSYFISIALIGGTFEFLQFWDRFKMRASYGMKLTGKRGYVDG